jgi:5-hydroxyisourate hydrolase
MPGVSIHVVDISRGVVAQGMRVELYAAGGMRRLIAAGALSAQGTLEHASLGPHRLEAGPYEAVFHVADYYARAGFALPAVPFLDVVTFRFGIAEPDQHYHLPMKLTPWGLSCFRGGA